MPALRNALAKGSEAVNNAAHFVDEDAAHDAKMAEFDHLPRIRFSHLKAFGRSAAHGQHAFKADGKQTYAKERGTALHAIIFGTRKVSGYEGVRRGKAYDAVVEANPETEILTMAEYDKTRRMADAVVNCQLAAPLLKGEVEKTIHFRWQNLDCRVTPDVRAPAFVTELKSSVSSDPAKFLWQARRMGYHAQLRFQEYGCNLDESVQKRSAISDHYIVCVESEAPYPVSVFHVEPEALEEGEKLLRLWAERLKNSVSGDYYPGYTDCIMPMVWPKDDVIEFGEEE